MLRLRKLLLFFALLFEVTMGYAQMPSPIAWSFAAAPLTNHETTISIKAQIPPGWHLYSQSIAEGGPIPTRIKFASGDDYLLQGLTIEKGDAAKFYDNAYEMEITWYSGVVTFLQRVILTKPGCTIEGSVEYMTCNDEICVPGRQAFSIEIPPERSLHGSEH